MTEDTYAEALFEKYKGKVVEILFDSNWGMQKWADFDIANKPVMVGEIVDAVASCVDVKVSIQTDTGYAHKVISVNSWSIMSVSEYDPNLSHIFAFKKQVMGKQ